MSDTFCEEYNDPTANILLKSNEGTLFRVHSYYLQAHSSVFRDMIEASEFARPSPPHPDDKAIDIDASSTALHAFLDLLTRGKFTPSWPTSVRKDLFDLCERFDCKTAGSRLAKSLVLTTPTDPWFYFCIADRYKDVGLARVAISYFAFFTKLDKYYPFDLQNLTVQQSKEVSHEFLLGLVRAIDKVPDDIEERSNGYLTKWVAVADHFWPAR